MTSSPHQPPAACQSAANPLRKAFSAPAKSEPDPIHEESRVKTRMYQGRVRPATR